MILCVALIRLASTGVAAARPAGYEFFARTHAEGSLSAAVSMADSAVHGWAEGPAARVEITDSRNPMLPRGALLFTHDGGLTAVVVRPGAGAKPSPWNVGRPGFREPPDRDSAMTAGTKVRNLKIEKLADEPGGTMNGFATRHFRFRVAYDLSVELMGDVTETSTIRLDDLWTAPDLKLPGISIWIRRDSPGTGDPQSDQRIADAYAPASGTVMKRVTASTLSGPSGLAQTTKTTWEVTNLHPAAISPGLFEPPAARPAVTR